MTTATAPTRRRRGPKPDATAHTDGRTATPATTHWREAARARLSEKQEARKAAARQLWAMLLSDARGTAPADGHAVLDLACEVWGEDGADENLEHWAERASQYARDEGEAAKATALHNAMMALKPKVVELRAQEYRARQLAELARTRPRDLPPGTAPQAALRAAGELAGQLDEAEYELRQARQRWAGPAAAAARLEFLTPELARPDEPTA